MDGISPTPGGRNFDGDWNPTISIVSRSCVFTSRMSRFGRSFIPGHNQRGRRTLDASWAESGGIPEGSHTDVACGYTPLGFLPHMSVGDRLVSHIGTRIRERTTTYFEWTSFDDAHHRCFARQGLPGVSPRKTMLGPPRVGGLLPGRNHLSLLVAWDYPSDFAPE